MGQKGQKKAKPPLKKRAVADCMKMHRSRKMQGNEAEAAPSIRSASSLYIFGYCLPAALTETAFLLQTQPALASAYL